MIDDVTPNHSVSECETWIVAGLSNKAICYFYTIRKFNKTRQVVKRVVGGLFNFDLLNPIVRG